MEPSICRVISEEQRVKVCIAKHTFLNANI